MRTLEERKSSIASTKEADLGRAILQFEENKLVQEMQLLIKRKGLKVDVVPTDGERTIGEAFVADGCSSCTICPCMICW